jgi:hypothetical protein
VCIRIRACSLANAARNAYASYFVTSFVAPPCAQSFRHCLINGAIFGEKLFDKKRVVLFSLQLLSKIFLILTIIQRDIVINVKTSSRKVPVILSGY